MKRGGFYFEEAFVYAVIIFIAVVIFGFFYAMRIGLEQRTSDDTVAKQVDLSDGNLFLQTYLRTRMDTSASQYLGTVTAPSLPMTFVDALPLVLEDECRQSLLQDDRPTGECATFRTRTSLFLDAICEDNFVLVIRQAEKEARVWKPGTGNRYVAEAPLIGEQVVPTKEGSVTVMLHCTPRWEEAG